MFEMRVGESNTERKRTMGYKAEIRAMIHRYSGGGERMMNDHYHGGNNQCSLSFGLQSAGKQ